MNEFFTVAIQAQQKNERHNDTPKPTTPEPSSPPENPVEIQNNGPKTLWLTGFSTTKLALIEIGCVSKSCTLCLVGNTRFSRESAKKNVSSDKILVLFLKFVPALSYHFLKEALLRRGISDLIWFYLLLSSQSLAIKLHLHFKKDVQINLLLHTLVRLCFLTILRIKIIFLRVASKRAA